jgi:hypothetical protein
MMLHEERDLYCIFFFRIHVLIHITPGVASITVTMKPAFGRPVNIGAFERTHAM